MKVQVEANCNSNADQQANKEYEIHGNGRSHESVVSKEEKNAHVCWSGYEECG
jgi:hypothetical protein